jgi:hypothetical protein
MSEIVESHRITGNDCFQVKVVVRHMVELEAVIDRIAKFGPVTTSVILATHQSKTDRRTACGPLRRLLHADPLASGWRSSSATGRRMA